jgi:hypothetical protein
MKKLFAILPLLFCVAAVRAGEDPVLKQMYDKYRGKWHRSLRFIQETERYRNDTLISKATWYETMVYPLSFRIDFGVPDSGNCVIFRNDSAYIFKAGVLAKSRVDSNELLLMLGGMYFAPSYDEVVRRFYNMGYDVGRQCTSKLNGNSVYVIGANDTAEKVNQVWVDKKHLCVVKHVKYEDGKKQEAIFEGHQKLGDAWCETLVSFYVDGKLLQKERYNDVVADAYYDPVIFSPVTPWQYHWYTKR